MGTRKETEYDVEISASVTADELIFHEAPEVGSQHRGSPESEGTSGSDRSGLPKPVETGTVYEDVRVDYRLASRVRPTEDEPEDDSDEE
ncbi:hypothetical protein [Nocardiopsis prasina]|uniref:hypothetical protein n=1 Tax=Nocardiopsis prasina TaxID=2015 RepID=UPI000345FE17|nr:hypothetical protein [Nocardiopsis prasina]